MIAKDKMDLLDQHFQRIFTLPVTRTTFRELQSAISTALDNDNSKTTKFIDDLLLNNAADHPGMMEFIKHYFIPFRVAKQVHDNGEALSMLTTDVGAQGDTGQPVFTLSIRRIDGGEFRFITDTDGFLQVAEHILARAESISSVPAGKASLHSVKTRLEKMSKMVEQLINQAG